MKVVKVINLDKTYLDKSGKERVSINFYLVLDNEKYIAIRPQFAKGYTELDTVAIVVKNGSKE